MLCGVKILLYMAINYIIIVCSNANTLSFALDLLLDIIHGAPVCVPERPICYYP